MKKSDTVKGCMADFSHHHYQRIEDHSITAHTLAQIHGVQPPNKSIRYICTQCGNVITVK